MTATDELRRLLDECGVEWMPIAWNPKKETFYHTPDGVGFCADEYVDGVKIYTDAIITPEQAIDATLGRGTCRDVAEFRGFGTKTEFRCSECGYEYSAVGGFGCDYGDEPDFRYCPNCGRRVIGGADAD